MMSVRLSWMVASAIAGLPMMTTSAGCEMRRTLARSTMTEMGSAATDAVVEAARLATPTTASRQTRQPGAAVRRDANISDLRGMRTVRHTRLNMVNKGLSRGAVRLRL